jgi:hypothetical protein
MISEPIDKAIRCTGSQDALAKQCGVPSNGMEMAPREKVKQSMY